MDRQAALERNIFQPDFRIHTISEAEIVLQPSMFESGKIWFSGYGRIRSAIKKMSPSGRYMRHGRWMGLAKLPESCRLNSSS